MPISRAPPCAANWAAARSFRHASCPSWRGSAIRWPPARRRGRNFSPHCARTDGSATHSETQPATLWALARDVAYLCENLRWPRSARRGFRRQAADQPAPALPSPCGACPAGAVATGHPAMARTARGRRRRGAVPGGTRRTRIANPAAAGVSRHGPVQRRSDRARDVGERIHRRGGRAGAGAAACTRRDCRTGGEPLLAAAWPELVGADTDVAIAVRADAVHSVPRPSSPLSIVKAVTLEEEAIAVAQQVVEWRRAGMGRSPWLRWIDYGTPCARVAGTCANQRAR